MVIDKKNNTGIKPWPPALHNHGVMCSTAPLFL
jgi:hypothetical protein